MDSKDILLVISLVAIVFIVGIMQFANVTALNNAALSTAAMSQSASKSNLGSGCLKGLQNAGAKLECVQADLDVLGYALYLQASGDSKAAKDYCKNAPTTGCQGLCTAALNCLDM